MNINIASLEPDSPEPEQEPTPIYICKCLRSPEESSEKIVISPRKQKILSTVARTEKYLQERRIPELIRFLMTKIVSQESNKPLTFLETLLNDCMLFRAGHGIAPVLFEKRHLEAVIKSFDPGQRGWLNAGQIRRAYATLGLTPNDDIDEKVSVDIVLKKLQEDQESELYNLLCAGQELV